MRRRLFLFVLFSLVCWLPAANCPTSRARGDGSAAAGAQPPTLRPTSQARGDGSSTERPSGWRRTEFGWEEASSWRLDARPGTPARLPNPATAVHPLVIAALELLISVGALVVASPASRKQRR